MAAPDVKAHLIDSKKKYRNFQALCPTVQCADRVPLTAGTIPTMVLKINVAAAYIMPPACRSPREEFRRFQVLPAGAGKFLAAQGWQLP